MILLLKLAFWAPVPALLLWALLASRTHRKQMMRRPVEQAKARGVRDNGFGFWPRIDTRRRAEDAARMAALPLAAPSALALCLTAALALLLAAAAGTAALLAMFEQRQAEELLHGMWNLAPPAVDLAYWAASLAVAFLVLLSALRLRAGKLATTPIWAGVSLFLVAGHFWLLAANVDRYPTEPETLVAALLFAAPGMLVLFMVVSSLRGWLWLMRHKVPMQF